MNQTTLDDDTYNLNSVYHKPTSIDNNYFNQLSECMHIISIKEVTFRQGFFTGAFYGYIIGIVSMLCITISTQTH